MIYNILEAAFAIVIVAIIFLAVQNNIKEEDI